MTPAPAAHAPMNSVSPNITKIQMSSVTCIGCKQPAAVDEDKKCEFCRRRDSDPAAQTYMSTLGRVLCIAGGIAAVLIGLGFLLR